MIIELRGVDFINKGGELMMLAVIAKVKQEIINPIFVMEKSRRTPRAKYLNYGIYTKTNFNIFRLKAKHLFAFIPTYISRQLKFINENEIDVILDASGFAYGDVWGAKKASPENGRFNSHMEKRRKKVILLPQAFGPFSDDEISNVMRKILNHSDLIFARDHISLQHLAQLEGNNERLTLAPDFTNLIEGTVPAYFDGSVGEVAVIVNGKMIETTSPEDGEAYQDLLVRLINKIIEFGCKPYFLIHEGKMDRKVAELINKKLKTKLPVIEEEDPLHIKGIIAKSRAVVTSRFHGLVSCLSQAVPCLATGWSHKYEMLLKDYNYPEALMDVYINDKLLTEKVHSILLEPSRLAITENLKRMSATQKQLSAEMWTKVINTINE